MNSKVDAYILKAKKWQREVDMLRSILLECGLTEEWKWGKPCYTFQQSNIALIQGFKEYCAILFFKGVLLPDPEDVLIKTGKNTRVGRQIRFTTYKEVEKLEPVLKTYIQQAIEVEKAGLKVNLQKITDLILPEDFKQALDANPALKTAFEALTPGRQRAYIFYFTAPKQSQTRDSRIEKCTQRILEGKGLND